MVGWHQQFNGHEFEQAPGVGDGQGSLACFMQSMGWHDSWSDFFTASGGVKKWEGGLEDYIIC